MRYEGHGPLVHLRKGKYMFKSLGLGLLMSSLFVLGACASKTDEVTTASTDTAAHQCAADCAHGKDHKCSADCQKDHKCTAECKHDKNHNCGAECKHDGVACEKHASHTHVHGKKCGHKTVKHGDHVDYMHDGHQHGVHEDHVDEHKALKATATSDKTNS